MGEIPKSAFIMDNNRAIRSADFRFSKYLKIAPHTLLGAQI